MCFLSSSRELSKLKASASRPVLLHPLGMCCKLDWTGFRSLKHFSGRRSLEKRVFSRIPWALFARRALWRMSGSIGFLEEQRRLLGFLVGVFVPKTGVSVLRCLQCLFCLMGILSKACTQFFGFQSLWFVANWMQLVHGWVAWKMFPQKLNSWCFRDIHSHPFFLNTS